MIIRSPFFDKKGDDRDPGAVDSNHAAAGLGVSVKTLGRLRRLGIISAFAVQSRIPGRVMWRYPLAELWAFKRRQLNNIHVWDPHSDGELPAIIVAKFLGVSLQDVYIQRHRGRLKDYRPKTVCQYLMRVNEKRIPREIRQEFNPVLSRLRAEERRLRQILKRGLCECCNRKQ